MSERNQSCIGEHLDFFHSLKKPAFAFLANERDTFSKLGGLPDMPEDLAWPEWKGEPLAFLCQVDLQEVPGEGRQLGLPARGILYFFYDQQQRAWGSHLDDKGSWRVLYTPGNAEQCIERERPPQLRDEAFYSPIHVDFVLGETYPSWEDERVQALNMTNEQDEEYIKLCTAISEGEPSHRLLGYPLPVQRDDMYVDAELAINGIFYGDLPPNSERLAEAVRVGQNDWLMLLQLDSDNDTGMMWGDTGMLYFWIRKKDLAELKFDDCWMVFQCS